MTEYRNKIVASCHCGSVKIEVNLPKGFNEVLRCNCSICSRGKGFGMICVPAASVKVIHGTDHMTEYTFKSNTSPHFFCKSCGIHTHHKSRARPDRLCINLACVEGVDIHKFSKNLIEFNGINHPKDM